MEDQDSILKDIRFLFLSEEEKQARMIERMADRVERAEQELIIEHFRFLYISEEEREQMVMEEALVTVRDLFVSEAEKVRYCRMNLSCVICCHAFDESSVVACFEDEKCDHILHLVCFEEMLTAWEEGGRSVPLLCPVDRKTTPFLAGAFLYVGTHPNTEEVDDHSLTTLRIKPVDFAPSLANNEWPVCCLCKVDFRGSEMNYVILHCAHHYHLKCMDQIESARFCSKCNGAFDPTTDVDFMKLPAKPNPDPDHVDPDDLAESDGLIIQPVVTEIVDVDAINSLFGTAAELSTFAGGPPREWEDGDDFI